MPIVYESKSDLEKQSDIFGHYYLNRIPNKRIQALYVMIIASDPDRVMTPRDERMLQFATKRLWSLGFIDAGLAILLPNSEVRRRLYIMFAILEASPEYTDYFLAKKHNPFYIFTAGLIGLRAVIKTIVGCLLVKAIR